MKEMSEQRVKPRGEAGQQKRHSGILKSLGKSAAANQHGWRPSHRRLNSKAFFIVLEKGNNVSSHSRHSHWITGHYSWRPGDDQTRYVTFSKSRKAVETFCLELIAVHVRQQSFLLWMYFFVLFLEEAAKPPADVGLVMLNDKREGVKSRPARVQAAP